MGINTAADVMPGKQFKNRRPVKRKKKRTKTRRKKRGGY